MGKAKRTHHLFGAEVRVGNGQAPLPTLRNCLTLAQRFSRVSGTRHKVSVFKVRERREPFGLSLLPSR
jgi:hypothetical protein